MDPSTASALGVEASNAAGEFSSGSVPPTAILEFFFPGFYVVSGIAQKYFRLDLNVYIPLVLLCGALVFCWRYFSEYAWGLIEGHLMSVVDIRTDDEIYNMLMAWVASQGFAQGARRFVANTNLNSRSWFLWRWSHDDDDDEDETAGPGKHKKKALAYTPTFGSHWFWYQGRLLIFRRHQNRDASAYLSASQREEISISCFGRNPWILKELLHEARLDFMKRDEAKTLIYRGTSGGYTSDPSWQRCMARTSRPFSTVILNDEVKQDLIDDVTEYLDPATRRWYSNRGIPYRRGYLLHGPPGTGKSSLSLALAGFFKMRIYIVSLSSGTSNEENLSALFAELPRRCVVLLEDIDTAGLTHTRENGGKDSTNTNTNTNGNAPSARMVPGQKTPGNDNGTNNVSGRLSLSGLLNILDGVASQEGRVLIMTTNHVEKLDKALIRPGRVDMIVKFDRADKGMTAAIFRAIYAPLDGDNTPAQPQDEKLILRSQTPEEDKDKAAEEAAEKEKIVARVNNLAQRFADLMPEREFSPAEIQGYLMKNKRSPQKAVEGAEQWIANARKEKLEKEAQDAEEKANVEKETDKKRKEQEEKKKKRKAKNARRKGKKNSSKNQDTDRSSASSTGSSSSSSEDSESEEERPRRKSKARQRKSAEPKVPAIVETKSDELGAETAAPATEEDDSREEEDDSREEESLRADDGKQAGDSGYGTPGSPQSAAFEKA